MDISETLFEKIKHINDYGQECWYARELQGILEYSQWRYMKETISRAMLACENSGYSPEDHFADVRKMVEQFRALNAEGQKIARNTIQGLVLSGAYIKNPASGQAQIGIG